jgi:prepilin-type N-terminal cleavage/methylation domain-containing protein
MRKAFTLLELVVAMAILAMILSFAGIIFRVSTDSQRMAMANAEIMQKLRVITEQLDADFRGLCKDGEVLIFWRAARKVGTPMSLWNDPSVFERYDTIMFFATGDFSTYTADATGKTIHGNAARICYTLANVPSADPSSPLRPISQKAPKRMLVRTQHVLVPTDPNLTTHLHGFASDSGWQTWSSREETDATSVQGWLLIPNDVKANIISVTGDVQLSLGTLVSSTYQTAGGVLVDRADPASMYTLLCDGAGQFEVQGWLAADPNDPSKGGRWAPDVDPDKNRDLLDCDLNLILDPNKPEDFHSPSTSLLRYPDGPLRLRTDARDSLRTVPFNEVPGLGRALKFTFTLYDSRGLIPNGRTFTHIVYLDN